MKKITESPRNTTEASFKAIEELSRSFVTENVIQLIGFFGHQVWAVRKKASDAITAFGEKAVPMISQTVFLTAALDDDTLYWCIRTAGAIGGNGLTGILVPLLTHDRLPKNFKIFVLQSMAGHRDPEVVSLLIASLSDPSWAVRRESAALLQEMGEGVVPALKSAFATGNEDIRYWTVKILGHVMGPGAIDYFRNMLKSPKKETRYYAVAALGEIDSEEAMLALAQTFSDESWLVRAQVAEIFEKRGKQSIKFLKKVFESGNSDARFQTIRLMGKIMGREAKTFIEKILASKETEMKFYAVSALAETNDPDAVSMIVAAFSDEVWLVRKHAAETLAKLGTRAVPRMEALLAESRDENLRHWALTTLAMSGPAGLDALLAAYDPLDKKEKKAVIATLRSVTDERAFDILFRALGDKEWPVRSEAATALEERIGEVRGRLVSAFLSDNADIRFWVTKIASAHPAEVLPALREKFVVPEIPSVEQLKQRTAALILILAAGGEEAGRLLAETLAGNEEDRDYALAALRQTPTVGGLFVTLAEAWCAGDERTRGTLEPFVRGEVVKNADLVRRRLAENPLAWLPLLDFLSGSGDSGALKFLQSLLELESRDVRFRVFRILVASGTIEAIFALMNYFRAAGEDEKIAMLATEVGELNRNQIKAMVDQFRTLAADESLWLAKLLAEWGGAQTTQFAALLSGTRDPKVREWLRKLMDHLEGKEYL